MDQIEPDALYDERGDISRARPLLQGDVFEGVVLPGFGAEPKMVQIVAHPCAMRTGAKMTPRITVAPVMPHQRVGGDGWNGNLRVMPLEALTGEGDFATKFVDVTACPMELLTRQCRIATLTNRGIYVLQQRLIKHYTRVEMGLDVLRKQSAPTLTEAEVLWDWLEIVLTEAELDDDSALDDETKYFEQWIRSGTNPPQVLLQDEIHHSDIRREARRAAEQRAKARENRPPEGGVA